MRRLQRSWGCRGLAVDSAPAAALRRRMPAYFCVAVLAFGSVALVGCSEEVSTASPVDHPFTLYGILNPRANTQTIAVFPIEPERLSPRGAEPLDAVVRSTDLTTGAVRIWRDSVVTNEAGRHEHMFWSDFRAEFGRSYLIEAVRPSDGATTSAVAHVPSEVVVLEEDRDHGVFDVHIRGPGHRLVRVDVRYDVRAVGYRDGRSAGCIVTCLTSTYTIRHTGKETRSPDGWVLEVRLGHHVEWLRAWYALENGVTWSNYPNLSRLELTNVSLDVTIGEEAWDPPRGVFDPNVLSQHVTMTNVEKGFGFVGGGYRLTVPVYPAQETLEAAIIVDGLNRPPGR